MRRGGWITLGAIAIAAASLVPAAAAPAASTTQPVAENRPQNQTANHTVPGHRMLRDWRKQNKMPYRRFVDGNFTGTTDEIIQWAAYKWGLDEDVLRAVAVVESWWRQSTVGGHHSSYGIFQVRAPFHCSG